MSTTVNVRVDKSKLTQKLKEQSEATRFGFENGTGSQLSAEEKEAFEEAVAEAVAAAKKRSDDANFLKRKGLRDPTGRRDGSGLVLPNGIEILSDAAAPAGGNFVQLARVGVRWNSSRTKVFVYPWGIEGAVGERLSTDYATAVSQASGLGTELTITTPDWAGAAPPPPSGTVPAYRPDPRVPGAIYDTTLQSDITSFNPAIFYYVQGYWARRTENDYVAFPLYDSTIIRLTINDTVYASYIHYSGDLSPGTNNYTYYTYLDTYPSARAYVDLDNSLSRVTTEFVLPVGGSRALYVLVVRSLAPRVLTRLFYGSTFNELIDSQTGERRSTNVSIAGGLMSQQLYTSDALLNDVLCVLVDGSTAVQVPASDELIAACATLVPELDFANATGTNTRRIVDTVKFTWGSPNVEDTTYRDLITPAFELSNLPKAPYSDKSDEEQALAKHLGLGYIETETHTGPFYTPAVFEWLNGNATFSTDYADVAPAFYTPADENNPFVGVYISVPVLAPEGQTMRLTATQPLNVTNAHQAVDWYTINTGSKWGDYLVWDWGNPEYCQKQLASLGMNL